MRLLSVTLERFGALRGIYNFDPRITVIFGPNESGKSTLHTALRGAAALAAGDAEAGLAACTEALRTAVPAFGLRHEIARQAWPDACEAAIAVGRPEVALGLVHEIAVRGFMLQTLERSPGAAAEVRPFTEELFEPFLLHCPLYARLVPSEIINSTSPRVLSTFVAISRASIPERYSSRTCSRVDFLTSGGFSSRLSVFFSVTFDSFTAGGTTGRNLV